jgi:hypothetical protein
MISLSVAPPLPALKTTLPYYSTFWHKRAIEFYLQKVSFPYQKLNTWGVLLTTSRQITVDRKVHIRLLMVPSTKGEVLSFLGLTGYLRSWIPSFALLAQPLYEAARGPLTEPLDLIKPIKTPFLNLQEAHLQALALSLPNLDGSFKLYVTERGGMSLGVLGQMKGPTFTPIAYLSKQLDPVIKGWQPCLCALAMASPINSGILQTHFWETHYCPVPRLTDLLSHRCLFNLSPSRLQLFHLTL